MTEPTPPTTPPLTPEPSPLRSVHTANLGEILQHLKTSLFVTTYQAGKLVVVRADGKGGVNTHFRDYDRPMGLALEGGRLAIGTSLALLEFHDSLAVAKKLDPAGSHDGAFLPRIAHTTGDIQIHELAWAGDELWFVNTRFSCLCTRSAQHSFVPRWRPKFITKLAPEDRCHLNGLAVHEGKIRFVTAMGETDTPGGWRSDKKAGGIVIDVASDTIITRGLSMPHSPRVYAGQLWVLNSGCGGLGTIDPATGNYREVVRLPGFTRGLAFAGPLAFVGLSQVRESAVFSGIEIASMPIAERCSGVWVVNIETGAVIARLQFEEAVQEIFAVSTTPGMGYPDVVNDTALISESFILPDEALADVDAASRSISPRVGRE